MRTLSPHGEGPLAFRKDETYAYFPHDADVGIVGRGSTVAEAMESGAEAMFALMGEPSADGGDEVRVEVAFEEEDLDLAFVEWLNLLLAECRIHRVHPTRFELRHAENGWQGTAWGPPLDRRLRPGVEVKGATLTMLSVRQHGVEWEARCVVDV